MSTPEPPLALLAELTHRCPLQCPYCSNPLDLQRAARELDTESWKRIFDEAAALGVLHIHFSGGEPAARKDLEILVAHCSGLGLYTNLITSAVLIDRARLLALAKAGLNHVQISVQASDAANADRIGGYAGGHARKLEVAGYVREAGLPLTLNAVMHRQNLDELGEVIELAVTLGARRLEVAHVQYYGWALKNRAALMPSRAQLERATATVEAARVRLKGILVIDYVVPDYYARRPKACMGGWGRRFLNVAPSGDVLPCHAASTLSGLTFDNVKDRSLKDIWCGSSAFERFRGTGWMPEPCRACDQREVDWGGCRCQAFALTGDLTEVDPACEFSGHHAALVTSAESESAMEPPEFVYRRIGAAAPA